jgi:hypothetical protein
MPILHQFCYFFSYFSGSLIRAGALALALLAEKVPFNPDIATVQRWTELATATATVAVAVENDTARWYVCFCFFMRLIEKKKCRIYWALLCLLLSKNASFHQPQKKKKKKKSLSVDFNCVETTAFSID